MRDEARGGSSVRRRSQGEGQKKQVYCGRRKMVVRSGGVREKVK